MLLPLEMLFVPDLLIKIQTTLKGGIATLFMNLLLGASTPHFLPLRATGVTTDGAPNVCLSRCQIFYICYLILIFKKLGVCMIKL